MTSWPSRVRPSFSDSFRLSVSIVTVIWRLSGRAIGLIESDDGQIGLTTKLGTCGWTIGPPAESACAVEPVGVDTISPSALKLTTSLWLISRRIWMSRANEPWLITASLSERYVECFL